MELKPIEELELGFTDAQIYGQRHNKSMFAEIFVKNRYLDNLLKPQIYFLLGEKGTGKTAYATFLSNREYKENKSILQFLSATDYDKFYILKKQNNLDLTGYVGVWKVILLLLLSKYLTENKSILNIRSRSNIPDLISAIMEYYENAFAPEISTILKVVDESEIVARIISKFVEAGGNVKTVTEFSKERFQTNLLFIEKSFSDAVQKLQLSKSVNLFIDGIDVRPDSIPYSDYLKCIQGLTTAAWILNTELFANLRDSKGHIRVILLLRPDIYSSLSLQNATNKLLDNAVFLEWRTTYQNYLHSSLYKVANKILSYQQDFCDATEIWERYFPWRFSTTSPNTRDYDTAFMEFLKISLSRPRDILVILHFLRNIMVNEGSGHKKEFSSIVFRSDEFQNCYSEYFMGSLKDQLSFYYSSVDFAHFLKFFDLFKFSDFDYQTFVDNFHLFIAYIDKKLNSRPEFLEEPNQLLQLLYDSNTIAAIEQGAYDMAFFHFSYREKNTANINPKVPIGESISYRFHYGLYKKIKYGRF